MNSHTEDIKFVEWLKQDGLFDYYHQNPHQQDEIYNDYLKEKEYIPEEFIDFWVDWMSRNPTLAKEKYPILMKGIEQRIQQTPRFLFALLIQKLPDFIVEWKQEAKVKLPKQREAAYKSFIDIIENILYRYSYQSKEEQQALNEVKPFLIEHLEDLKKELHPVELNSLTKENSRTKDFIFNQFSKMDSQGIDFAFRSQEDYEIFQNALVDYFEKEHCKVPKEIRMRLRTKTRVSQVLYSIYNECGKSPLSSDYKFISIVRSLDVYKDQSDKDIVKSIQR